MKITIRLDELEEWWPYVDAAEFYSFYGTQKLTKARYSDYPYDYCKHRDWKDQSSPPAIRHYAYANNTYYAIDTPVEITIHNYMDDLGKIQTAVKKQMELMEKAKAKNGSAVFFWGAYPQLLNGDQS